MPKRADPLCVKFRTYVRQLLVSEKGRRRVREAVFDDNNVLAVAMRIAAGRLEDEPGLSAAVQNNFFLIESLSGLPLEALRRYAETGQLEAASWAPDVALAAGRSAVQHVPARPSE